MVLKPENVINSSETMQEDLNSSCQLQPCRIIKRETCKGNIPSSKLVLQRAGLQIERVQGVNQLNRYSSLFNRITRSRNPRNIREPLHPRTTAQMPLQLSAARYD
ncbi:hypothetical protein AV530_000446 [Patagioenas fasciata monilis]|uniref:Uncharacterized protein n=1 Tax=Patagioenas fasciata monilis TaxID=372326 RepID=A0A1V4JZ31_PATFA|nr:hypothetical protein AV530_000446 [Patagioenas fasciata monilis]